jgi:hypothetical protein
MLTISEQPTQPPIVQIVTDRDDATAEAQFERLLLSENLDERIASQSDLGRDLEEKCCRFELVITR